MLEHSQPRGFEIVFRSSPRLCEIVCASLHLPLPPVPYPKPLLPPEDPARREREERQAIEQVLEQLRKAADQFAACHKAMIDEMRQAAIELAVAVAGRVVFDKLQAGEFPIEEMVHQALSRLPAAPALTVYLPPDDLALLKRRLASEDDKVTRRQGDKVTKNTDVLSPCHLVTLSPYHGKPAREASLRIEADPSLKRGGCRAEAGEIHVLADLADQLAGLRQHLLWSANHAQSGPGSAAP